MHMPRLSRPLRTPVGPERMETDYPTIVSYEHHFNDLQAGLRQLASVWLMAAMGAIAWMIQEKLDTPAMDVRLLMAIVCTLGNAGLLIIWILDQLVYHRLLNAVFLLGLRMEYLDPQLPPIRSLMMLFSRKRGMSRYLRLFYLVPMGALAVVALTACNWHLPNNAVTPGAVWLFGAGATLMPLWVWWRSTQAESYADIAEGFGDPSFVTFVRQERYESLLRGH